MQRASKEVLDGLKELGAATVFMAVAEDMRRSPGGLEARGGHPENYTGPEVRCLLPDMGTAIGYAVTAEVTTNDPDSVGIPWDGYYQMLEETPSPIVAVMKDVDSRPGRGNCFGNDMAATHKARGVTGALVGGSVGDLMGIREVGFPVWGSGLVPGGGVFTLVRMNASVTVAQLRIHPGELLVADMDGCTKIPAGHDPAEILRLAREIHAHEQEFRANA